MSDPACSVADERSSRVRPAVSAIYGIFRSEDDSEGDDGGELVGTGLFVTMRDRPCILTAAHVAVKKDERTTNNESLFVGLAHTAANGSPPAYIRSRYLCLGPPEDLAFALADAQALQQSAVVPVDLGQFADEPEDGDFFVLGFPGAGSHFSRLLDAIQSTALPLLTQRGTSRDPYFNAEVHFALQYTCPDPSLDGCGRPRAVPDPKGVSGSPVWVLDQGSEQPRVVGVVQRHDPVDRVLIVTRGSTVRRFLCRVDKSFANL